MPAVAEQVEEEKRGWKTEQQAHSGKACSEILQ